MYLYLPYIMPLILNILKYFIIAKSHLYVLIMVLKKFFGLLELFTPQP